MRSGEGSRDQGDRRMGGGGQGREWGSGSWCKADRL